MSKFDVFGGDGDIEAHVKIFGNSGGRFVVIKTPFDFSLTPDEAAEILREFWEKTIVPIQTGLKQSTSFSSD